MLVELYVKMAIHDIAIATVLAAAGAWLRAWSAVLHVLAILKQVGRMLA